MEDNIKLLYGGETAFSEIIAEIERARESIFINMFIWRDDITGNEIAEKLYEAALRGVKVCIVKDKLGSVFEYAEEHKQSFFHKRAGLVIRVKAFFVDIMYPMKGKAASYRQRKNMLEKRLSENKNITVFSKNVRNDHSKFYIFDDRVLITGGMNIEDKSRWKDVSGRRAGDFMIKMTGSGLVERFKKRLGGDAGFKPELCPEFILNRAQGKREGFEVRREFTRILRFAENTLVLVMAYFGDKDLTEEIIRCLNRGVQVTIIAPGKANIQQDLNMKTLSEIVRRAERKPEIFLTKEMLHAKLVYTDGERLTFGSANFNRQATKKLGETNVVFCRMDKGLRADVERSIKDILKDSKRVKSMDALKYSAVRALAEELI